MKIAECKPFLDEVLITPLEVQLHRQAKIKAITYSNQIEGNKLDEKAVTSLLGTAPSKTKDKDAKEILNYQNAFSYADKLAEESKTPSIRDFCDLQKLVTADVELIRFSNERYCRTFARYTSSNFRTGH